jgi:hypothetical protein
VESAFAASLLDRERPQIGKSPWSEIVRPLSIVLRRREEFPEALGYLEKFCRNLRGLHSAAALGDFVAFLSASETQPQCTPATASLNAATWDLEDLLLADDTVRQCLITKAKDRVGAEAALFWSGTVEYAVNTRAADAAVYLSAIRSARQAPNEALQLLSQIDWPLLAPPLRGLVSNLRIALALDDGDRDAAVSFIAREAAASPAVRTILPAAAALGDRPWDDLSCIPDKLDLAIALDVLWRQTNIDLYGTYVRFSFEDYLFQYGYAKPSAIDKVEDVLLDRTIYFLRYICIPSVMDQAGIVSTSRELVEERIAICRLLESLDPQNAILYEEERNDAARRTLIEDGMQIVDSSRVNVDTAALSRWAENRYRESYSRYRALVDLGIGVAEDYETVVKNLLRQTNPQGDFFNIPTNEADTLLLEIILSIKEEFLNNPQHGLEFYLGKRIRHGTLTGHLRGPVENANLITQRTSETGPYKPNDFWLGRLAFQDSVCEHNVAQAFTHFAAKYDEIIRQLKDIRLHVTSKQFPKGVFDIPITNGIYRWIRTAIQTDVSHNFEAFLKACYTIFWASLEPSLSAARRLLSPGAKEAVARAFDQLHGAARANATQNEQYQALSVEIRDTGAAVQRQLDMIVEWLKRSEVEQASHPFKLEEIVDISVQSALKAYKSFSPQIEQSVDGNILAPASVLIIVADIIFVIIDNVFRRSMAGANPDINIACTFDETGETLTIEIVNSIGGTLNKLDVERRLAVIRDHISKGEIQAGASGEGGSGLLKIAIITRESKSGLVDFGFLDHDRFRTKVTLPVFVKGNTVGLVWG